MKLEFKLDNGAITPTRANATDAGLDLHAKETELLHPGEVTMVDTGVSFKIPEGYVGLLFQRSSFVKFDISLANCVGVIDAHYRGNIKAAFRNHRTETSYSIQRGDKVAQLVIVPMVVPTLSLVTDEDTWNDTVRGTGGFGSSGV